MGDKCRWGIRNKSQVLQPKSSRNRKCQRPTPSMPTPQNARGNLSHLAGGGDKGHLPERPLPKDAVGGALLEANLSRHPRGMLLGTRGFVLVRRAAVAISRGGVKEGLRFLGRWWATPSPAPRSGCSSPC